MTNPTNEEIQAAMKVIANECSKRDYAFIAFAAHLPPDGSPPMFAYNVSGGSRAVAEVFREAADLLERGFEAGAATVIHAERVN
ncbi:MAG TPA: hypothetical protein VJW77_04205 [Terriglobia bacterium]|nr:hypothetical protein [Terriglobia bacterium]